MNDYIESRKPDALRLIKWASHRQCTTRKDMLSFFYRREIRDAARLVDELIADGELRADTP